MASSIVDTGINALVAIISDALKHKGPGASLTQYTRDTNIMSRVYIEASVANDDIALPLLGMLNQMYACWVITALNFTNICQSGRTVGDTLRTVRGNESYKDTVTLINDDFGQEVLNKEYLSVEATVVDVDKEAQRLVTGRLIELDFLMPASNSGDKPSTFKLYLYVQLFPYILTSEICNGFLTANFTPSLTQRWRAVKAGEISFWKDFVFAQDLIKKQADIVRKDKSGVIAEMLFNKQNMLFRYLSSVISGSYVNRNAASNILIISKETFEKACREANVDFTKFIVRQKCFATTMSVVIGVVDTLYGTVDLYFNGLQTKGTYNFNMINKIGSKGKDSFDLKEIMTAMTQGNSPKF